LGYIKNGKLKSGLDRQGFFHTNGIISVQNNVWFWGGRLKHTRFDKKLIRNDN
jgi:hypothetical protein